MGAFNFMKNIFKVVFVIIGTLIGAGFASGQEMYIFFFSYGLKGILGIIISCILMGFVIYKTLKIIKEEDISNYKSFIDKILNTKSSSFFSVNNILNIIINIFIIVTFFIMIAGFGAYFEQTLGINSLIASSVLALLSFLVFMKSVKGFVKVNEILIPILIILICIIGFLNIKDIDFLNLSDYITRINNSSWVISAILYCSYNSILLIPALITLRPFLGNKKSISIIAFFSTIAIMSLSLIIYFILVRADVDLSNLEMPVVYVVSNTLKGLDIVYGFIIVSSIFTTAISLGTSFLQNFDKNKKSYTHIAIIMCITGVIISKFGFSNLVNLLYPIFGYLGIVQILRLFFSVK